MARRSGHRDGFEYPRWHEYSNVVRYVISLGYRPAVGRIVTVELRDHYEREQNNTFYIKNPYVSCSEMTVPISALFPRVF
jgi:hypothetical protein